MLRTCVGDDLCLDGTDAQGSGLRWVHDGAELTHTEHAQVGHRDGAALVVVCLQLVGLCAGGQLAKSRVDARKALVVCVPDYRSDQAVGTGRGDCHVDVVVHADEVVKPAGVYLGYLPAGQGRGLDYQIVQSDGVLFRELRVQPGTEGKGLVQADVAGQVVVRHLALAGRQAGSGRSAQIGVWDVLEGSAGIYRCGGGVREWANGHHSTIGHKKTVRARSGVPQH